jgi:rhodanese-related sulfurtransferase
MYLQEQGLRGARSVAGGIDLWSVDIDPSVPRYTK